MQIDYMMPLLPAKQTHTALYTLSMDDPSYLGRWFMAGATFFPLLTVALLPYASMSSFLYDRHFFQSEDAAGIYPCSAFYLANVTMEMVFNGMNGVLFGAITYYLMNFQAFVQAPNPSLSALGYVASLAWTDILANVRTVYP